MSDLSHSAKAAELSKAFVALSLQYAGTCADPYPVYAEKRHNTPVFEGDLPREMGVPSIAAGVGPDRKMFTLLKYADVHAALVDSETFTTEPYREVFGPVQGEIILMMGGTEHRFWRTVLTNIFQKKTLDDWTARLFGPTIERRITELAAKKKSELLGDFMLPFPLEVVYQMLGLPVDPEQLNQFSEWALLMALGGMADFKNPEQTRELMGNAMMAADNLFKHLKNIVQQRRAENSQAADLISLLVRSEVDGRRLQDDEIVYFVRSLLPAAGETTTRSFSNVLATIMERPGLYEQIRADRSLVPNVINEALRFEGIIAVMPRLTTRDVEIRGVKIPAGSGVNLIVNSANRDEDAFENPNEFNINRKFKMPLTFGFGAHMCMGMMLSKIEMGAALNSMLDHMPNMRLNPNEEYLGIKGIQFRTPPSLPVIWD
ncbi:MAG: eryK [Verrucomicrobiaceae bacterium]|nr:eryK [Verrucomicrobiaceae bacterium]